MRRRLNFLLPALLLVLAPPSQARPREFRGLLSQPVDPSGITSDFGPDRSPGVQAAASIQDTVLFGGTIWNPDSARWEALRDSMWTFDSGVGSHFRHDDPSVNPYKNSSLHALMEGWVGFDNTYSELRFFRRVGGGDPRWDGSPCVGSAGGLGGNFSFWAGVFGSEADSLCYAGGRGYGNAWNVCIDHAFTYVGGAVTLRYTYVNDTEPDFDYTSVRCDRDPANGDEVELIAYDGPRSGRETLILNPGVELPSNPGPVVLRFCVASDGAYSDQDGLYVTACGAFAVDDIQITDGISHVADFESGNNGWTLQPARPGPGGDWSNLVDLSDLPPQVGPCGCGMRDTVLVFEDLEVGGHNNWQDNMAASPWIDLKGSGLVGVPGKFLQARVNADLPLLNYIFAQYNVQWYPQICLNTGKLITSSWTAGFT